jgi:signal transduction histidine kinase
VDRAADSQSAQGGTPVPGPRSSIRTRIVRTCVALALVPLAVLGAVVLISLQRLSAAAGTSVDESRAALRTQVVTAGLEGDARELGDQLDRFLLERVRDVRVWASDPLIRAAAQAGTQESDRQGLEGRGIEELEGRFRATPALGNPQATEYLFGQVTASGSFAEVFFTEANGYNVAFSSRTSDFVQSDEGWWQNAWAKGLDVGPIAFDESARVFSSDIAVRITDGSGNGLGVLKAVLNLGVIHQIADAYSPRHNVTVLNEQGLILAETVTRHDQGRVMNPAVVFPATVAREVGPIIDAARARGTSSVITSDRVWAAVRTGRTQPPVDTFSGFNWIVLIDDPAEAAFAPLASVEQVQQSIDGVANLLAVLVILAMILVGVVALSVSRPLALRIVRPILRLRDAADEIATTRLPQLVDSVDRLQSGETLPALDPITVQTGDEVEELADKFNSVVATAGRLAAEQVESRRHNLAATFISMGRRNQKLLGRQLRVLDELERNEADPQALEGLFTLDQLATRMRRNAESLLVLAGQRPTRRWTHRVPIHDVIRSAVSEIEEFARIDASSIEPAFLRGDVLAEVAHLLAELCENATAFSPPDSTVEILGRVRGPGYRISIVDRGIGMSEEELARANGKLAHPDGFDRVPSQYLGLFVVGRLAERLGIEVHLFESAAGGLIARVTLPADLLDMSPAAEAPVAAGPPAAAPGPAPAAPDPAPAAPEPVTGDHPVVAGAVVAGGVVADGDTALVPGGHALPGGDAPIPLPAVPAVSPGTIDRDGAELPRLPVRRRADISMGTGSRRSALVPPGVSSPGPLTGAARFGRSKRPADWFESDGDDGGNAAEAEPVAPPVEVEVTSSGFRVRQKPGPAVSPPARLRPAAVRSPEPAPVPVPTSGQTAERARSTLTNFMSGVNRGRREVEAAVDAPATPDAPAAPAREDAHE